MTDALYTYEDEYLIGEAKSSKDLSCFRPVTTFSCAHYITRKLIQDCVQLNRYSNEEKGFIQAFLSQSFGYLDAVINSKKAIEKLIYIMQLCPNSKINENRANQLYNFLSMSLNILFDNSSLLTKRNDRVKVFNEIFYLDYDVNHKNIENICDRITRECINIVFENPLSG